MSSAFDAAERSARTVLYRGGSMRSRFRPLDRLSVEPVPWEQLRAGDVVLFRHEHEPVQVIHRLTRRRGDGWLTRGDDRLFLDRGVLSEERYLGRVETVWREEGERPVLGGWAGQLQARLTWVYRLFQEPLRRVWRIVKR